MRAMALRVLPDLQPWWPWRSVREAVTGADGRYAIEGLWTTVYHVDFVDEAGDHATQGYGGNVGVLTGEEVDAIDMALQHEGHIDVLVNCAGYTLEGRTSSGLSKTIEKKKLNERLNCARRFFAGWMRSLNRSRIQPHSQSRTTHAR